MATTKQLFIFDEESQKGMLVFENFLGEIILLTGSDTTNRLECETISLNGKDVEELIKFLTELKINK